MKVELFVDGVSEGELPCCSPRMDVMDVIDGAPLRTGFNGVISWGRFSPGLHTMELVVTDSEGNVLTETRLVHTVNILPGVGFARDLSLASASCVVTGPSELTCTGADFAQGACAGAMKFRWLNGKQALEVVEGCAAGSPTATPVTMPTPVQTPTAVVVPTPVVTPTAGSTPTPGPTGSQTIADCMDPVVCPAGCIDAPLLGGFGFPAIVINEGEDRTYCAPVLPPHVVFHPTQIKFEFYDESDLGCGFLFASVEQTTGDMATISSGVALPDVVLTFRSEFGGMSFPERTQPGIYRIHITGGGGCATTFRLTWSAL